MKIATAESLVTVHIYTHRYSSYELEVVCSAQNIDSDNKCKSYQPI